jgi:glutamate 5-kinase
MRQAAAAVGQPMLMDQWATTFKAHDAVAAQVLLTQDDIADRQRCLHLRDTLEALLRQRVVPVINENDSVSVEGVTFGENDLLAAMVSVALAPADLLVYLCDQEGLCTADPQRRTDAELIPVVGPDEDVSGFAAGAGGPESTGGMVKKVEAARKATDCGIPVVIANGRTRDVLVRIVAGAQVGTRMLARAHMPSRKAWLTVHGKPAGGIVVDDGARRALLQPDGGSLLPSGVLSAVGHFQAGDLVTVSDSEGREIARGLVNYSAAEVATIRGHHSSEIPRLLGRAGEEEVIHRDDLVLTGA